MSRLSLTAAPTFKAAVAIPVAGGASVPVEFVFRHRTKTALAEFVKDRADKEDLDAILAMAEGWSLEDKFGPESVAQLLENYIGAAMAIWDAYVGELIKAKAKN